MVYLSRLRISMILFVLVLLISACTLPPLRQIDLSQIKLPAIELKLLAKTPIATDATTEIMSLDDFTDQLMTALEQHDYTHLQTLMGDSFVMADWRAEGRSLPSQVAIVQLRNHYLLPDSAIDFPTTVTNEEAWHKLLGGSDPLPLWDSSVETVKAIYVTGLSVNQQDEALLIVAQQPNGAPYWYSMVVASGGFQPKLASTAGGSASGAIVTTHRSTPDPQMQSDLPHFITFASGTATAKVKGVLHPGQQDYLVRALAGQRLLVNLASLNGQAELTISSRAEGKELQELANGLRTWTATVPATQEYLFSINTDAATPFELITTLDQRQASTVAEPAPVRILFASGTSATTITKQVAAPVRHRYLLRGVAGQTLQINLVAAGSNAGFAVQGITDGRPLKRLENTTPSWKTTLSLTQDYLITVAPTGEPMEYTIEVGVQ